MAIQPVVFVNLEFQSIAVIAGSTNDSIIQVSALIWTSNTSHVPHQQVTEIIREHELPDWIR